MTAKPPAAARTWSLREFARRVDLPSVQSPLFHKWNDARKILSDLAWDQYSGNAYEHYRVTRPAAGPARIARTGKGPPGTWMIFENSALEHKGIESQVSPRPTIAINLAPSGLGHLLTPEGMIHQTMQSPAAPEASANPPRPTLRQRLRPRQRLDVVELVRGAHGSFRRITQLLGRVLL
jgi:hypothetical protein